MNYEKNNQEKKDLSKQNKDKQSKDDSAKDIVTYIKNKQMSPIRTSSNYPSESTSNGLAKSWG